MPLAVGERGDLGEVRTQRVHGGDGAGSRRRRGVGGDGGEGGVAATADSVRSRRSSGIASSVMTTPQPAECTRSTAGSAPTVRRPAAAMPRMCSCWAGWSPSHSPPRSAAPACHRFAVVASYLSTATTWGLDSYDVLTQLFTTGAWLPPAARPC